MKKLNRVALERKAELRADFGIRISSYNPNQLVFVDESAVDRRITYRGYAWALKGKPAHRNSWPEVFCSTGSVA